jgi:hypothetical protein
MAGESVKKISYVERVLVTLNQDGSLKGAAQYALTRVTDQTGKSVVPDIQGSAEPVSDETLKSILENSASFSQAAALAGKVDELSQLLEKEKAATDEAVARFQKIAGEYQTLRQRMSDLIA